MLLVIEFFIIEYKLKLNNEIGICVDIVRVCFCFGFCFDFLDYFGNFLCRIRNYCLIRDWIVKFLWENYEFFCFDEKGFLIKELFFVIGFELMSFIEIVLICLFVGNM